MAFDSLGVIMSIGIGTCMIAGLTFVPALLNLYLPLDAVDQKTRCQQNIVGTGVGGTEVKTSIEIKLR